MAVSPEETAAHLRFRAEKHLGAMAEMAAHARVAAEAAARLLMQKFGASAVWLFGSVVSGKVHPSSDVDLVVEGLSIDALDAARATLEGLDSPFPFELLTMESLNPAFRGRILQLGVRLL